MIEIYTFCVWKIDKNHIVQIKDLEDCCHIAGAWLPQIFLHLEVISLQFNLAIRTQFPSNFHFRLAQATRHCPLHSILLCLQ